MVNFARQRTIYQQKFVDHWSVAIGSCQSDPKALWSKLRPLLQSSSCPSSQLTADDFARFFSAKIEQIRATTADAPPPTIVDRVVPVPLVILQPTTAVEISAILNRSAAKQCQLDPAPSWLIKRAGSILAPVIANICNASFRQKMMPISCKHAIVRPLLKKPTLDPDDLNSYRPISNLSFLSKIVEKVVDARLSGHTSANNLLPAFQSAYRPFHSTETAMTCVFDGMIKVLDQGHVGALMLLDLSAAFDTVDPPILSDVLERRFGVQGDALEWLVDFLNGRTQVIRVNDRESAAMPLICGVPQGSVLGPKRFIEYAEDVSHLLQHHGLLYHLFADDIQGQMHCLPSHILTIIATLGYCFIDVGDWCASRRLQLNAAKTELLLFGTAASLQKIPPACRVMRAGSSDIEAVGVVRDLGVMIDSQLSMHEHVSRTARACFFHLRRLRSIRQQLGRDVTAGLVVALVFSRLDYCNVVLAGLPAATLAPLQRVIHAAARLVADLRPNDHVTPAIKELHWLPIAQRIDFKLCLLVHKTLVGHAPIYLSNMLTAVGNIPSRSALRDASHGNFVVPRTRLRLGDRAFSVAAPRAWNLLPTEVKAMRSTPVFKRALKTFLFRVAYDG